MKLTSTQLELLRETPLEWVPQNSDKYQSITFNTLERKGFLQRTQLETNQWMIRKTEDGAAASQVKKRLDLDSPSKVCPGCGVDKYKQSGFCKSKHSADGFQSQCRDCSNASTKRWRESAEAKAIVRANGEEWRANNPDKVAANKKRYRQNNLDKVKAGIQKCVEENGEQYKVSKWRHWLKKKYGLTEDRYYEILQEQGYRCAICGSVEKDSTQGKFCVDHCHDTGVVRGLLCFACNVILGNARDSTEILENCVAYLKKFPKDVIIDSNKESK